MFDRLRRMLHRHQGTERRRTSRALPDAGPLPPAPPLRLTRAELARTAPAFRKKLARTDAFLRDIGEMDGALRLVRR